MSNTTTTERNASVTTSDRSDGADAESSGRDVTAEPPDYGFDDAILTPIGNASSTCECCGTVVDGHNPDEWIICDLDELDFSSESHALLCRDCRANDPNWKQRVLKRRREQQINSRLDEAIHWVSRPPVKTLFLRRAAAGIALLLTATALTSIMTVLTSGPGSLWDILGSTNFAIVGGLSLLGVTVGYWLHLHDREKNDHRGTTVREHNISDGPWSVLAFTGGGMVLGTALMALPLPSTLPVLGLSIYIGCNVFAFKNLEPAVRADRCIQRVNWIPRYDRELFAMRASIVVGLALVLGSITLGALIPVVAIGAYLFFRKWYDLGPSWKLFYYGGDSGGDD